MEHKLIGNDGAHIIHYWQVADDTALAALTVAADEVYKIALKLDDKTYHIATSTTPTFQKISNTKADWNATSGDAQILNKPSIPSSLDSLTDVAVSSPTNGQYLTYNGTKWVNSTFVWTTANDVEITDATKGVMLKSPNGTRYKITVDDAGNLETEAV